MKKLLLSALLSTACLIATPVASTTVKLVGVPGNAPALGEVSVSPYTLFVNGQDVSALCIDFSHETNVGTSWSAYLSVDGGNISETYHPTENVQYEEVAWIYTQITKPGISAQTQTDLQEAAWDIMDSDYYGKDRTYAPDKNALQFVADAQSDYKQVNFSNFRIVSSFECPEQQEFLIPITTPEPASVSLFGIGIFGGLGVVLFRYYNRRRALHGPKLVTGTVLPAERNELPTVKA